MPFKTLVHSINMHPQMKTVLAHLIARGSITPMEAWVSHGIYRLSSIIHRLRKVGYPIDVEMRKDEAGKAYGHYTLGTRANA
jgi:Helix-turn-helix domain